MRIIACLFLVLAMCPRVTTAQPKTILSDADFVVGTLSGHTDSLAVRKALGQPDSIRVDDNPFDKGSSLVSWFYPDITINFGISEQIHGLTLHSSRHATNRGLRVGDSLKVAVQLYGEPGHIYQNEWEYSDPKSELHVIRLTTKNSCVREIFIGWLYD
jgi:hypothetical protein